MPSNPEPGPTPDPPEDIHQLVMSREECEHNWDCWEYATCPWCIWDLIRAAYQDGLKEGKAYGAHAEKD